MFNILIFLFTFLAILLVSVILLQPGKGDMGLSGLAREGQMLFGGSGGQNFFEKVTWAMGLTFMMGALALTLLGTREASSSRVVGYKAPIQQSQPVKQDPHDGHDHSKHKHE